MPKNQRVIRRVEKIAGRHRVTRDTRIPLFRQMRTKTGRAVNKALTQYLFPRKTTNQIVLTTPTESDLSELDVIQWIESVCQQNGILPTNGFQITNLVVPGETKEPMLGPNGYWPEGFPPSLEHTQLGDFQLHLFDSETLRDVEVTKENLPDYLLLSLRHPELLYRGVDNREVTAKLDKLESVFFEQMVDDADTVIAGRPFPPGIPIFHSTFKDMIYQKMLDKSNSDQRFVVFYDREWLAIAPRELFDQRACSALELFQDLNHSAKTNTYAHRQLKKIFGNGYNIHVIKEGEIKHSSRIESLSLDELVKEDTTLHTQVIPDQPHRPVIARKNRAEEHTPVGCLSGAERHKYLQMVRVAEEQELHGDSKHQSDAFKSLKDTLTTHRRNLEFDGPITYENAGIPTIERTVEEIDELAE